MIPWIKSILFDSTVFTLFVRSLLMFGGQVVVAGALPDYVPRWLGAVMGGAALMFPAGQKNPKETP